MNMSSFPDSNSYMMVVQSLRKGDKTPLNMNPFYILLKHINVLNFICIHRDISIERNLKLNTIICLLFFISV